MFNALWRFCFTRVSHVHEIHCAMLGGMVPDPPYPVLRFSPSRAPSKRGPCPPQSGACRAQPDGSSASDSCRLALFTRPLRRGPVFRRTKGDNLQRVIARKPKPSGAPSQKIGPSSCPPDRLPIVSKWSQTETSSTNSLPETDSQRLSGFFTDLFVFDACGVFVDSRCLWG